MFLLYISPQSSCPPSMARFLKSGTGVSGGLHTTKKNSCLSAPAASTTTSSSLSDRRVIRIPTTFFPCNNRRVEGSFWIILETATQAHLRSAGSVLSIYRESYPALSCLRISLRHERAPFARLAEFDPFSWKSPLLSPDRVTDGCLGPAWGCGVSSPFSSGTYPSPFMSCRYGSRDKICDRQPHPEREDGDAFIT